MSDTDKLTGRYGVLLSQSQLAELLGRSTGGQRCSLCAPPDERTRALKSCGWNKLRPRSRIRGIYLSDDLRRWSVRTYSFLSWDYSRHVTWFWY